MTTAASTPKRMRAKDFSMIECTILIDKFTEAHDILSCKHTNEVTERRKQLLIEDIQTAVNASGGNNRSINAIKEKWQNERRRVKRKVADFLYSQKQSRVKTGGGISEISPTTDPSSILNESEMKVYSTIPPESVEGIEGGVATNYRPNHGVKSSSQLTENMVATDEGSAVILTDLTNSRPLKRPRYDFQNKSVASVVATPTQDYYNEMIQIEKRKLELLEIEHVKKMDYLNSKTEYYKQLLSERRIYDHSAPQYNNEWTPQAYPSSYQ